MSFRQRFEDAWARVQEVRIEWSNTRRRMVTDEYTANSSVCEPYTDDELMVIANKGPDIPFGGHVTRNSIQTTVVINTD